MTHIILFLFVAGKNTDLFDVAIQKATEYSITEGARTTCYQQDFVFENGHDYLFQYLFFHIKYFIPFGKFT